MTSLVCVNLCSNKLYYKPGEIPVPYLTAPHSLTDLSTQVASAKLELCHI